MDIRQITPRYAVSPQIDPEDIAAIKAAGFTTVICNRPDEEVPPSHRADQVAEVARAAGLTFHVLPLTHQTMTPENVARQRSLIEGSEGPVLAYCASGTRCSVVWSLGQAGHLPVDQIMQATANAGYDLAGLRPQLTALESQDVGGRRAPVGAWRGSRRIRPDIQPKARQIVKIFRDPHLAQRSK